MKERWKRSKDTVSGICLVAWVLMLFVAVLFVSLAFSLFDRAAASEETYSIDMIVRIGWLLSGFFALYQHEDAVSNPRHLRHDGRTGPERHARADPAADRSI